MNPAWREFRNNADPVCRKSPGRAALDALLQAETAGGGDYVYRRA